MGIQSSLGQPIPITIGGQKAKLHPMSLYEVGLLESSYIAYCRRQSLESTLGLPDVERIRALNAEIEHIATLDIDATPIFEWVIGSHEGLCRALSICIETPTGQVSPREAGNWDMESGKDSDESPTCQWMIASRLRSDPTDPAEPAGESDTEAAAKESSTEHVLGTSTS
jgi:hypothetical protein